jgi:transformation/transcription domain-associated protein
VLDESGTLSNLLQLWQLVVRHPDVFYDSRAQFMSQMINTLSRIGMPQQASLENRKLSLDLAGLLLAWEDKRRESIAAAEAAAKAAAEAYEGQQTGGWLQQAGLATTLVTIFPNTLWVVI